MKRSRIIESTDKFAGKLRNTVPVATALVSTVVTQDNPFNVELNALTTVVRVYAVAKDVYLKWATTSEDYVTEEDFDEVIPAGQVLDFRVPDMEDEDADNGLQFPHVQLVGRESGATIIVTEK